jgi:FkbM family methyltransferase
LDSKILTSSRLREKEELRGLQIALSGSGIFLDLGANSGYYSMMAILFGAERVLAVEANPSMCERLQFNAEANEFSQRVEISKVALGDRDGTAELLLLGGDLGSNRIARGKEEGERIDVPMRSLLSLLMEKKVERVAAMKIDVEGMEDAVLLPFFEKAPSSLWPEVVIIEHAQKTDWKEDALSRMKTIGYETIGRTRSNETLRFEASMRKAS